MINENLLNYKEDINPLMNNLIIISSKLANYLVHQVKIVVSKKIDIYPKKILGIVKKEYFYK